MPRAPRETPWLDRRQGGSFYAYWYDATTRETKRLSLRTTDAREAQDRFAAFLVEGDEIIKPRGNDGLTVSRALDDYFKEHVHVKCVDVARQSNAINHLKQFFGEAILSDIDIPKCRRYAEMRRTGAIGGTKSGARTVGADGTIRRELCALAAAANHARKWKRITVICLRSRCPPAGPSGRMSRRPTTRSRNLTS